MRNIPRAGAFLPRNSGFSLIEGVVIVSLIGIVAAFAVSRFTRLANTARATEVVALSATLRKTLEAAHAQFLASGAHLSATTIEGKRVHLENGYPDTGPNGIRNAVFDSDGFSVHEGPGFVTFFRADAPTAQQCAVTYRAAPASSDTPTVDNIETSGC
jgi:MSHA pilin protein MshA